MKFTITIVLALVCLEVSYAQNYTFERLRAKRIKDDILFRIESINNETTITYEIDVNDFTLKNKNSARSKIVNDQPFYVSTSESSFNVLFEFINPLVYNIKVDGTTYVDPTSAAYENFFNNVLSLTSTISNQSASRLIPDVVTTDQNKISSSKNYFNNYSLWDYGSYYDSYSKSGSINTNNADISQTLIKARSDYENAKDQEKLARLKLSNALPKDRESALQALNKAMKTTDEASERVNSETRKIIEAGMQSYPESFLTKGKFRSEEILDWVLWQGSFSRNTNANNKKDSSVINYVNDIAKKVINLETYLYDTLPDKYISDGSKKRRRYTFEKYVATLYEDMEAVNSLEDFRTIFADTKKYLSYLEDYNNAIDADLTYLNTLDANRVNKEATDLSRVLMQYTLIRMSNYSNKVKLIKDKRKDLIEKFKNILSYIDKDILSKISSDVTIKPFVVAMRPGESSDINVEVTKNEYTSSENGVKKMERKVFVFSLKVSEYASVVPEFGIGTIYSELNFPKYSVDDNGVQKIIVDAGNDQIRVTPVSMLNLIPNIGYGYAYWMVQLGIGMGGGNRPLLLAGTGVRIFDKRKNFYRNISLTGGAAFRFVRQLSRFNLGDTVASQADLDRDLSYQFNPEPTFYLGIQFNFQ